jgi:hypothetical protein
MLGKNNKKINSNKFATNKFNLKNSFEKNEVAITKNLKIL